MELKLEKLQEVLIQLNTHCQKQQEIKAELQPILQAIETQNNCHPLPVDYDLQISELKKTRESILADQALGIETAGDLKAIEKELAGLEAADRNRNEKDATAKAVINGLQYKLNEVQARLEQHNSTLPDLVNQYLTEKSIVMGQHYMNAALQLDLYYVNLLAIGRVINGINGGSWTDQTLTRPCWDEIEIPLFSLPACSDHTHHHLQLAGKDNAAIMSLVTSWKDELRGYGLNC